jgi:hypothetical protein
MKESPACKNIVKFLSLVVTLSGILVIIGWVFDISFLKSIFPVWISMKFDTAVVFFLSGITLYYIARAAEGAYDLAQVTLFITTLIIMLFMGVLFFSTLFGIHTGAEDLFVRDSQSAVKTVVPGRPSVPTMANFLLIALAGILTIIKSQNLRLSLRIIGVLIGLTGLTAVGGYIINAPLLYYYIAGVNAAMALHTAVLFVLLGVGLLCL